MMNSQLLENGMYVFEKGEWKEIHSSLQILLLDEKEQPTETIYVNVPFFKECIHPTKTVEHILSLDNILQIDSAISECFPVNSIWKDRDFLFSQAKKACSHSKFLNTHHVVLHSIHPRNDTPLLMNGQMLLMKDLVVVISCLQRKMSRNSIGCGLPIEGLTKVAVPCDAFYLYSQNILQTKGNTRFLFDNVEREGNGSGFVNRTNANMMKPEFSEGLGDGNGHNS